MIGGAINQKNRLKFKKKFHFSIMAVINTARNHKLTARNLRNLKIKKFLRKSSRWSHQWLKIQYLRMKRKLKIKKISNKETQVILGPYNSVNLLKNDYIQLKSFGFEELDIYINE